MASIDLSSFVERSRAGDREMSFAVEGVSCAACVGAIERGLADLPGLARARVNLTARRLTIGWRDPAFDPAAVIERLDRLGYPARPFAQARPEAEEDAESRWLIRCTAVAFFGAMNIMLLSVSVWSGNATDITPETRDLFHWFSALIALPIATYAGQPFFRGAWRALRGGRVDMDVPISLGVILALALSLHETMHGATHAYFDSAVMLLFFLLVGRTLDRLMRKRARRLAANLLALRGESAARFSEHGDLVETPVSALVAGDRILVRPGDRVGADGIVEDGCSEVDQSLVTGETTPVAAAPGARLFAGSLNLGGALTLRVERASGVDLVEEVDRLLSNALATKDHRVVLADRAARAYAPFVHVTAALTLAGWLIAGASAHQAIVTAIAVLIVTCPCALGLAVPAVQVVAAGALFRRGILLQSGDALERIADCDMVVFDKTGTLTSPNMRLANAATIPAGLLEMAARLALSSRHPLAVALAREANGVSPVAGAVEITGSGVRAEIDGRPALLGSPVFVGVAAEAAEAVALEPGATALAFRWANRTAIFLVKQHLRTDAARTIAALRARGLSIAILSGDAEGPVAAAARSLSVTEWRSGLKPADKITALEGYAAAGRKVLMVGDGLNDAPALAAAHASLSPASASHLAQSAADLLFLGEELAPVDGAVGIARRARRLMNQNLWLSVLYNLVAVPIAVAGLVTPLIAAAAMSGSSIIVTLNALRAGGWPAGSRGRPEPDVVTPGDRLVHARETRP